MKILSLLKDITFFALGLFTFYHFCRILILFFELDAVDVLIKAVVALTGFFVFAWHAVSYFEWNLREQSFPPSRLAEETLIRQGKLKRKSRNFFA